MFFFYHFYHLAFFARFLISSPIPLVRFMHIDMHLSFFCVFLISFIYFVNKYSVVWVAISVFFLSNFTQQQKLQHNYHHYRRRLHTITHIKNVFYFILCFFLHFSFYRQDLFTVNPIKLHPHDVVHEIQLSTKQYKKFKKFKLGAFNLTNHNKPCAKLDSS